MINIKKISLKFMLPIILFAIFLLLVGGRYFLAYKNKESSLEKTIQTKIISVVTNVRATISNALIKSDLAQAENIILANVLNTPLDKIAIILPNQHLLISSDYQNRYKLAKQTLEFYSTNIFKETLKNNEMIVKHFNNGRDIVIYAPIHSFNAKNTLNHDYRAIIYAHYSLNSDIAHLRHTFFKSFLQIIGWLVFAFFLFIYIVNSLLIKPINKLITVTNISDLSNLIEVEQNGVGEIGELQRAVSQLTVDVKKNVIKLTETEERSVFAFQSVNDGIWDWNVKEHKVYYSPEWIKMLGLDKNAIDDDMDVWESRIHPDDLTSVAQDIAFHFSDRTEQIYNIHRIMAVNGKYRWILCRAKIVQWDEKADPMRVVGVNTDITKYKETEAQLKMQSLFDPLTQLPNRTHLLSQLSDQLIIAKKNKQCGAIISIDCNQYETLTNIKGHHIADRLLVFIARRLEAYNCNSNFLAHLDGGEFAIIVTSLANDRSLAVKAVKKIIEEIDNKLKAFIKLNADEIIFSFTFGVELFPDKLLSSADVLRQSAMAMRSAKTCPSSNVVFFDKNIEDPLLMQHDLEISMHKALENNEFSLFFQARINAKGDLVGAEALSRWIHSEQGWVKPSDFIKVAEGSKLIIKLGLWVIQSAFQQLADWEKKGLPQKFTTLSINISPIQFFQNDFVSRIKEALNQTKVSPNLIEIEITETIFLNDIELIIEKINILRKLGIRFAIDDFGIGYSSFSYLSRLPIATIKIDQSFIKNMLESKNQQIIVAAIIDMSKKLKLKTVAEGIETKEQLEMLCNFGCAQFQGFYIYKPLAKNDFQSLLFKSK